ncbi:MAG: uridine kinase, partial [Actinobacteria bacterium]|nr:uridine kinase [Actinomycetota bacterium]
RAQVVLLCVPSGSGKTHIAARSGLPVFRLDDFYRDGDDPALPISAELGIPDWDDPRSWRADDAVAALDALCREGRTTVPTYDISLSATTGEAQMELGGAPAVVAEGVFAAEIVEHLRDRGLLADAVVLRRAPWKNFVRRFARDLAERRKPPATLWRRGRILMGVERDVVQSACDRGCRAVEAAELAALLRRLRDGAGVG